ncbi:Uncharacterized protein TCAP_04710 [Tolypocladium capitatum]|uniref:Uncharacterized protein n=1 Tax=Tolypocladium capitatum TaxID=45235 RepID=A0A2K3QCT9_9HYPO|nr:Uncharacterized protein TCAP_04710 [Tolypocladium capitatum]
MFTSHPIPPSALGEQPGFATTQLRAFALTNHLDAFLQGATAFRNGRELAKRFRDEAIEAIEQANKRAREEAVASPLDGDGLEPSFASGASADETIVTSQETIPNPGSNIPPSYDSDTSADETLREIHPVKRIKSRSPRKR